MAELNDASFTTPELHFVKSIDAQIRSVLWANHLQEIVEQTLPGRIVAANAHPAALDAYAKDVDLKIAGTEKALERNGTDLSNPYGVMQDRLDLSVGVREVWAEALHNEANMPVALKSSAFNAVHPSEFKDSAALDNYIAEVAQAASAMLSPALNRQVNRGAEEQGLA